MCYYASSCDPSCARWFPWRRAQLIELYGEDARLFLLQCLVEETGFKEQKAHAHHGNKDAQKVSELDCAH